MNRVRKPLIAGNWKMNLGGSKGVDFAKECVQIARACPGVDVAVFPPSTVLARVAEVASGSSLHVGGQNLHEKDHGAFTGEVSGPMIAETGSTWVLVGHSERRQYFGETDDSVRAKTESALRAGLVPIVCVGETLLEREAGRTLDVVERQVLAVREVLAQHPRPLAIAYEPVWAIGTGKVAGPAEAEEVHAAIRAWLSSRDPGLGNWTRILYGGSVKADNAAALLGCANIDGALIGGASLDAASFGAIARAAQALTA